MGLVLILVCKMLTADGDAAFGGAFCSQVPARLASGHQQTPTEIYTL